MKRYKTKTICEYCKKEYQKETYDFKRTNHNFCSKTCYGISQRKTIETICGNCEKIVETKPAILNNSKSGRVFCSQSCAASYNNTLKRKSRRSKIEIALFNLLIREFPQLQILPNDKTMLDGFEVDIAIPELKLGIEWNGIVHFKPIYGQTKLDKIKDKDKEKLIIASNKDINLIIISDLVSNDKILKISFNECKKIIEQLLTEGVGNDPTLPIGSTP